LIVFALFFASLFVLSLYTISRLHLFKNNTAETKLEEEMNVTHNRTVTSKARRSEPVLSHGTSKCQHCSSRFHSLTS